MEVEGVLLNVFMQKLFVKMQLSLPRYSETRGDWHGRVKYAKMRKHYLSTGRGRGTSNKKLWMEQWERQEKVALRKQEEAPLFVLGVGHSIRYYESDTQEEGWTEFFRFGNEMVASHHRKNRFYADYVSKTKTPVLILLLLSLLWPLCTFPGAMI